MSTGKPILDAWVAFSAEHPELQQFGQTGDVSTFNGATGCTHACFQRLILGIKGQHVTQDQISRACGHPWPRNNRAMRGMYSPQEGMRVVVHYGLPYQYLYRPAWSTVLKALALGPVLLPVKYDWWPEWRGCVRYGVRADGRPNGFAFRGGKTQIFGFSGTHAVLVLGYHKTPAGYRAYANEPNHGAPARPEKPPYDIVTTAQLKKAWEKTLLLQPNWAYVPTRAVRPKGFA